MLLMAKVKHFGIHYIWEGELLVHLDGDGYHLPDDVLNDARKNLLEWENFHVFSKYLQMV